MSLRVPTAVPNRDWVRKQRLLKIEEWAKGGLKPEELNDESQALKLLADKAIELFEVSGYTSRDYARVVYWRLKRAAEETA